MGWGTWSMEMRTNVAFISHSHRHLKSVNYSFLQQSKPNSGRQFSLVAFFKTLPHSFQMWFSTSLMSQVEMFPKKDESEASSCQRFNQEQALTSLLPKNCGNTGLWAEETPIVNNPSKQLLKHSKLVLCQVLVRRKKLMQKGVSTFYQIWDVRFQIFTVHFKPDQPKYDMPQCNCLSKEWRGWAVRKQNTVFNPHQTKGSS